MALYVHTYKNINLLKIHKKETTMNSPREFSPALNENRVLYWISLGILFRSLFTLIGELFWAPLVSLAQKRFEIEWIEVLRFGWGWFPLNQSWYFSFFRHEATSTVYFVRMAVSMYVFMFISDGTVRSLSAYRSSEHLFSLYIYEKFPVSELASLPLPELLPTA